MNNLYFPAVISSRRLMRSILLSFLAFIVLTLILPDDAFSRTRSARTVGGTSLDAHHHGLHVQCTWPEFEGEWSTNDGSDGNPISVKHSVGDQSNPVSSEYATCSGWHHAAEADAALAEFGEVAFHAEYTNGGFGKFYFDVTYSSDNTTTCIEDANSGIGNNCKKGTDLQNKKHSGTSDNADSATLACSPRIEAGIEVDGTTLTYQFFCAEGVRVDGFLRLVPEVYDDAGLLVAQDAPDFTKCSAARVAGEVIDGVRIGACTMHLGGIPMKTVKIKGVEQPVVDVRACDEAFPYTESVSNALGTGQAQPLEKGALLFYVETAYTGACDIDTKLPDEEGSPTTAYGRYCQSDIDTFADNLVGNVYLGDLDVDGFDNELRICESNRNPHIGEQDVETIELSDLIVESQPNLNLNCSTGGNTDSGGFKVTITDQAGMLASNVHVYPITGAPTLEGVSPSRAPVIITDDSGVDTLVLTYPTCEALSLNVIANDDNVFGTSDDLTSDDNNTNVFVELLGRADTGEGSLSQTINAQIEIKVNGL